MAGKGQGWLVPPEGGSTRIQDCMKVSQAMAPARQVSLRPRTRKASGRCNGARIGRHRTAGYGIPVLRVTTSLTAMFLLVKPLTPLPSLLTRAVYSDTLLLHGGRAAWRRGVGGQAGTNGIIRMLTAVQRTQTHSCCTGQGSMGQGSKGRARSGCRCTDVLLLQGAAKVGGAYGVVPSVFGVSREPAKRYPA